MEETFPVFGEIQKVLKFDDEIFILFNELQTLFHNSYFDTFEISEIVVRNQLIILSDIDFSLKNFQLSYNYKNDDHRLFINYLCVK